MSATPLLGRPMSAPDSRPRALLAVGAAFASFVASLILASPASAQSLQTIPATDQLQGVACPSATLCLGVGFNNSGAAVAVPLDPATGQIASGQSVQIIPGTVGGNLDAVACASATLCLAVGFDGEAVPLDPATGQIASGQIVHIVALNLFGVACPSATLCLGVGANGASMGEAVPIDPATGKIASGQGDQFISGTVSLTAVACASVNLCLAVGDSSTVLGSAAVPLDPATGQIASGQSAQGPVGIDFLEGVVCPSATCLAVGINALGTQGFTVPLDLATGHVASGQSAQAISGIGWLQGVACPTAILCVGAGYNSSGVGVAVPLDPGNGHVDPGQTIATFSGTQILNGVACVTATLCLGVGATSSSTPQGVAVPIPFAVATSGFVGDLFGVACPSATLCLGVGLSDLAIAQGMAVPLDPATGHVASGQGFQIFPAIDELTGVACASATLCLAVGTTSGGIGVAVPLDPATGHVVSGQSVQAISGMGGFAGVACPSTTLCLGVGGSGEAVPLDPATGQIASGQSVQTITGIRGFGGVACRSATLCLAVGVTTSDALGFGMVPLDPATGQIASGQSVQGVPETDQLFGVACPSATLCLAVGTSFTGTGMGVGLPLDPATGQVVSGQSAQKIPGTGSFNGVACPSATLCFAVGIGVGTIGSVTVALDPATGQVAGGQSVQTFPGNGALREVACASATLCLAVGNDGLGDTVAVPLSLGGIGPVGQVITFTSTPPQSPMVGGTYVVSATASSALTVSFSIDTTSTSGCSISGATVTFAVPTGTCVIDANQPGNANYLAAPQVKQSFTVGQGMPVIAWANPSPITFGTPLGPTQLDAVAKVSGNPLAGIYSYNPTAGAVLQPGNNQTLSVTFTPTDSADYTSATSTVSINVVFSAPCFTTTKTGRFTVAGGQSICVASGGKLTGPVTVSAGAALWVSGGSITGPIRSTGALALTLCGTHVVGPITVTGSTGYVLIGGAGCSGNTLTGPVSITSNTGGVGLTGNKIIGPLTITGNKGGLQYSGNTVTGPVTVTGNT